MWLAHLCCFLQIGDVDRCTVYVSLAPGMENPAGEDPLEEDAARCAHYTSSEEEQARPVPTTEERVSGKRPMPVDPSPMPTLPAESSRAPKRRRFVRIDDDEEEEEAVPSLVRRPPSRPDGGATTADRVAVDPPAPRAGESGAQVPTGRTRRRFTATHRRSNL
jgi:hypothetical protein